MAYTYFWRDFQTLHYIQKFAIPRIKSESHIDLWDAGCAMGPEPYSLAILLRENLDNATFERVRLFATDIDGEEDFEGTLKRAVYPMEQLERIPETLREKYLSPTADPDQFEIRQDLKDCLIFQRHDLLTLKPLRHNFGLIMCKNVLLHFSPAQRVEVIKMFHSALAEGGFFVSEQTQKMPAEASHLFKQVVPNAQLYQKI